MFVKVVRSFSRGRHESVMTELVQSHKNVICLQHSHPVILKDGSIGMQLSYPMYDKKDLADLIIDQETHLTIEQKDSIFHTIVKAVEHCHNYNVAHLDLKPENIVMSKKIPILADFGCARLLSSLSNQHVSTSLKSMGTDGYCAPEIINEKYFSSRSDVWSLACLAYALYTEHMPPTSSEVKKDPYVLQEFFEKDQTYFPGSIYDGLIHMSHPCSGKRPYISQVSRHLQSKNLS